jgi:hypothetical protein
MTQLTLCGSFFSSSTTSVNENVNGKSLEEKILYIKERDPSKLVNLLLDFYFKKNHKYFTDRRRALSAFDEV